VRGVLWLTHLWNVVFGQHRLHKLRQVQGWVVIFRATDRHFFAIMANSKTHDSLIINNDAGSQFCLVQRGNSARHLLNSVRELSDQASFFPSYKVAIALSAGATHSVMN
jgi:hypothetical protein